MVQQCGVVDADGFARPRQDVTRAQALHRAEFGGGGVSGLTCSAESLAPPGKIVRDPKHVTCRQPASHTDFSGMGLADRKQPLRDDFPELRQKRSGG